MSINLTVALVQKLRLSLQPVFQIMARQTSARFVDCTSARCDLFVGWPGLGLLEDHGFGLMSVFLIFHVLAVGCAWARCICSVGLGVPPAPQPGGFTCFVSAAAQSDVASTGRARCPNISRTPASSSANKIFTFMIEPSSEWFQNLSGDHANDECDRPNLQLHNFSAPQERARGFDCKASMLNGKGAWPLAAVNWTGSVAESVFPVANEEFSGTSRLNPAMGMGYAFCDLHGSGGWFLWPVTPTSVKFFIQL